MCARRSLHHPVNSHLTPDEAAYIVNDSGARVIVANAGLADVAAGSRPSDADVARPVHRRRTGRLGVL